MDVIRGHAAYVDEASQTSGELLLELKMHPWFELANFLILCQLVRCENRVFLTKRVYGDVRPFSERHPLSSYLASMLLCFAGQILGNLVLGTSPVAFMANEKLMLIASVTWYLTNFSPYDLFHRLMCNPVALPVVVCCRELLMMRKMNEAMGYGLKKMKGNDIGVLLYVHAVVCGPVYMRYIQRIMGCRANSFESPIARSNSKARLSFCVSLVMLAFAKGYLKTLVPATLEQLFLFFYVLQLLYKVIQFFQITILFELLYNITCALLFGGIRDVVGGGGEVNPNSEFSESMENYIKARANLKKANENFKLTPETDNTDDEELENKKKPSGIAKRNFKKNASKK